MRILRAFAIVVLVILVLAGMAQLVATPVAWHFTKRALADLKEKDYEGSFRSVHASVFPPEYRLEGLFLREADAKSPEEPVVSLERLDVSVEWREGFLHRRLVTDVDLLRPVVRVMKRAPSPKRKVKVPNLAAELYRLAPTKLDLLRVRDGEVIVTDLTQEPAPTLRIEDLDARLSNLPTRAVLSGERPTIFEMHGMLQRSGALEAKIEANPLARKLDFDATFDIRHLEAKDLTPLLESAAKAEPTKGSIDVFGRFKVREDHISGGVKPVLHDLELKPAKKDAFDRFKSWLTDAALHLLGRKQPSGDKQVATIIPIEGKVTDPKAHFSDGGSGCRLTVVPGRG